MAANAAAKAASAAPWRDVRIDGVSATAFAWERTGVLLSGADGFAPVQGSMPPRGIALRAGVPAADVGGSAACAIDARGYWLTAAHCVDRGPLVLVTTDGRELRWSRARIVWSGFAAGGAIDLALVHSECAPFATFRFARELSPGASVLCVGSGATSTWFAGGVLRDAAVVDGGDVRELHHDAPLTVGDSGGPAMLADGGLAGVDVLTVPRRLGLGAPDSTALLPDEAFVRGLIEADQRRGGAR